LEGIKQNALPWYHGVASCPMGKMNDTNAVVDNHGKVFGVKSLRVIDASIIPLIAPGHSMAPVYMVAEKLADSIKKGL
jgi:choline dehydrogenase